ncbi:nitroreductase family protein [Fusobacterium simiae]|uniref:Nitroreductase family protein n=1 Tax=Fusobacterium simiae TaxID=855 RepID=A0ABT4DGY8_FUSSI|nr:nitroreductase family protein [Fusobacterium simiae]MCY7007872.1 nitroreductase family protein [Fusobacterium simiae]
MIIENIKNTRSHRRFTEKNIKKEEILKMLEGVKYSSSAKNSQVLRYSYTIDDNKCQKLFSAVALGGLLKNEDKATLEERPRGFILISTKKDIKLPEHLLYFDIGIASQNIALIANELGYATCFVMSYNKKTFEEVLELPEDYDSKAVIILGESKDIVNLIDSKDEEDTKYFIENGIHHVPKLSLNTLILNIK